MQSMVPEVDDSFDFLFKIILVGDSNVGKTCVVQSFKSGIFMEKQQNTIGVDFTVRTIDIDGRKVKVSVFDFHKYHFTLFQLLGYLLRPVFGIYNMHNSAYIFIIQHKQEHIRCLVKTHLLIFSDVLSLQEEWCLC